MRRVPPARVRHRPFVRKQEEPMFEPEIMLAEREARAKKARALLLTLQPGEARAMADRHLSFLASTSVTAVYSVWEQADRRVKCESIIKAIEDTQDIHSLNEEELELLSELDEGFQSRNKR